jgi:L-ascorbate 6-phosphate lactonase
MGEVKKTGDLPDELYNFGMNDPFDRSAPIRLVVPQLMGSRQFMDGIRSCRVPSNSIAIWYLGQNGFILKGSEDLLIGIDLYLTNSCASKFADRPYRLDRQLPIFIEPEDLDLDVFITTHSHDDHADPETIRRIRKDSRTRFLGPFESLRVYRACGVAEERCELLHPGECIDLGTTARVKGTFALPTDDTDLNHLGVLLTFSNGITFYDTGDTAFANVLEALLPKEIDICAICINGGFHNLSVTDAAELVRMLRPRFVVPCHYDMMVNNVGSPWMLKVALQTLGSDASFVLMRYYEPWICGAARPLFGES